MQSIHNYLIQKTPKAQMTYTSELIPERHQDGRMFVPSLINFRVSHSCVIFQCLASNAKTRSSSVLSRRFPLTRCNYYRCTLPPRLYPSSPI